MTLFTTPQQPLDAFRIAARRGVLPTNLSSAEIQQQIVQAIRERSVFSARTTSARYLQTLREVINQLTNGDLDNGQARIILRQTLDALGYTPEGGFTEDEEAAPVPPAVEGTLQDLRSNRRLNLILETQTDLMHGAGQLTRGMSEEQLIQFPGWELVRRFQRREPRNWQERFVRAGGKLVGGGRMVAMKGDGVWPELGNSSLFDDALDVEHPPFAHGSGMRWRAVSASEVRRLKVTGPEGETVDDVLDVLPKFKASKAGLDADLLRELKRERRAA